MALAPKFAGQRLAASSVPTLHTIELYLDYVCPFSARMFKTFNTAVYPLIQSKYANKVQVLFRQQIQPWHPSSTLVHEAAIAVLRLNPAKFWLFSTALFQAQTEYFDTNVVNETRNKTYERLAKLADNVGVDAEKMLSLLKVSDEPGPNGEMDRGNAVTKDVMVLVKMNRLVGVHVTPTVIFNGIVANEISSSWTKEQWADWLEKNVA